MDKHYASDVVEARWLAHWEHQGAFAKPAPSSEAPYTVIMPPPNVTGSLHMGHALTFTLQDILVRYHRMNGHNVWWQPGLDHAGIATQMMVERQIWTENRTTRHDLGREAFLKKVWAWKTQSGGHIIQQLKGLGASTDWSHTCFTLAPEIQKAVRHAFVRLHREGLIYRAQRLVNWDPQFQTALSDLEVVSRDVPGVLYYIAYALEGDALVVATTRPETLFGDSAIAVHPDDERYQKYIGSMATIPLTGRRIPIIADASVDMDKGSGAVKITPAHDFQDYQMGLRHSLPMPVIMDEHARMCGITPETYQGLDRFEARKKVVADLEAQGFLIRSEPITHAIPHGDRSGVVLEPRLTDQWFLDAAQLAQPALEAVAQGHTVFVPAPWQKTYEDWLTHIQPWCLSRQIWWGHRIPAWYGPDGQVFVAEDLQEAVRLAEQHYGSSHPLTQDPDVLDTWFSAGLWPFVTLGWPQKTEELAYRYPTNVLVTGFDIIFFWVARMMMLGLYFMKQPPFRVVHIHGLIRDAQGQKMSKTKGNVVDPLELIQEYGADALRFALAWSASPGRDVNFSRERIQSARHFLTKMWNATRYITFQKDENENPSAHMVCSETPPHHVFNRWIRSRVDTLAHTLHQSIQAYHFHDYAHAVYHEIWDVFCDGYVEMSKFLLADPLWRAETLQTLRTTWAQLLVYAHPLVPCITQELWTHMGREGDLSALSWPAETSVEDEDAQREVAWVQNLMTEIRSVRNQLRLPPTQVIPVCWGKPQDEAGLTPSNPHSAFIERMTRVQWTPSLAHLTSGQVIEVYIQGSILHLALGEDIDLERERQRLAKERDALDQDIRGLEQRLSTPEFRARAPEEVLKQTEDTHQQRVEERALTQQWLDRLQGWTKSPS